MKISVGTIGGLTECAVVTDAKDIGPLMTHVFECLEKKDYITTILKPPLYEPATPYSLIVLRGRNEEILAWARRQVHRGSRVVPCPDVMGSVKDRWTSRTILKNAGLLLPETRIGLCKEFRHGLASDLLPFVLKTRRLHGAGVRLVKDPNDIYPALASFSQDAELVAERYVQGEHFTICFIEEDFFCFRKDPFAYSVLSSEPLIAPPAALIDPAKVYRNATGLHFGKLDVILEERSSSVFVVDAGVSANLWPVPDAAALLSKLFYVLATEVRL